MASWSRCKKIGLIDDTDQCLQTRETQMKITKVRITEFQSIQDSTEFNVGDVTCLVGKNAAGKTALLKALYRLNPVIESQSTFDITIGSLHCDCASEFSNARPSQSSFRNSICYASARTTR